MRKIVMITAAVMSLGAITFLAPNNAQARFGAGAMAQAVGGSQAQPAQYYGGYRRYPGYYNAYGYAGSSYSYPSGYRYPGSREALDTCSFC